MTELPAVSVLLVAGNQRERAGRALAGVVSQQGIERAEIVLAEARGLM